MRVSDVMKAKLIVVLLTLLILPIMFVCAAGGGLDQFGYNYQARVFVGKADGVDRVLDGAVWGDPTYADDHLVMKWSKAWDDARFNGQPWTPDAWEDNEWNGASPGGSGEVWHYKIIWVGEPSWDLTGTWEYTYHYLGGNYIHTMIIDSFDRETGDFSGHGYYNANPGYKWTIVGNLDGNDITHYYIDYYGLNPAYFIQGSGTLSADGKTMSGTTDGSNGQNGATWSATGQAIYVDPPYWRPDGYMIWGQFEVIMDQGTVDGVHSWLTHAIPTGYG